jgi:hypothetical protein
MSRVSFIVKVFLVSALAGVPASHIQANPPDTLAPYRFLPAQSTLTETGGIYPRNIDYRIDGTFDFATHWNLGDGAWGKSASFENVNAWAAHPILAYVLNLDNVLNLSGLTGHQLPVASPITVYKFDGPTQDGSTVNIYASVIGPWLHLHGGTTPPAGSADVFQYQIKATAHLRPFADYNNDGAVTGADLATWTSTLGKPTPGPMNDDHLTDGAGLLLWQQQVGQTPPSDAAFDAAITSAIAAQAAAVPEPAALSLLMVSIVLIASSRRRAA